MICLLNCQKNPALLYAKKRSKHLENCQFHSGLLLELFKTANLKKNLIRFFSLSNISRIAQDISIFQKVLSSWWSKLKNDVRNNIKEKRKKYIRKFENKIMFSKYSFITWKNNCKNFRQNTKCSISYCK